MDKSSDIYRRRINKVIDFVNDHLDKSFSLEELASVACFSAFHFHRIFVAVTGETVNGFTNRSRLEKAARLLRFSKKQVSEISAECGFSSSSTLSRAFREYFATTPSSYRQNGEIKNSKICKGLFPVSDYHCIMDYEELKTNFPVEIRSFPERRIAYIRVHDSFREGVVLDAFGDLVEWAKKVDLFDTETIFGMSLDDPMVTQKEKYRYEVCITIPKDFKIDSPDPIETTVIGACKYAVATVSGDFNRVATATNYLFNGWLINSSFEPEHQHALEIFLNKGNICDWTHFDLDLCIPVKIL